jgi:hypothetical protein
MGPLLMVCSMGRLNSIFTRIIVLFRDILLRMCLMDLLGNIYRMEKFIKVAFKMGNAMEKESLFGLINIPMKVIGRMDVNMEKEKRYLLMEKY